MECVEQWSGNQRMASGSDSLAHPHGRIFDRLFGRALERPEQITGGQREARSPRLLAVAAPRLTSIYFTSL